MKPRTPHRRSFVLIPALLLGGAACGEETPAPTNVEEARSQVARVVTPSVSEADRKALAEGNQSFALSLFGEVQAGRPNLVFSPASVSTALAMTYAGAAGATATEMAKALHFSLPQDRLHPAMNELTAALASRGEGKSGADGGPFRLRIVNSTWVQKDFALLPTYLDVLAANYGAGVSLLDFTHAANPSRETINRWVAAQTEDRIKDLLPPGSVTTDTRLVLTNAVYFNAAWKTPFAANDTREVPFTRSDGSMVSVPTMGQTARLRAAVVNGRATAVALPYQDERLSLLLVLPDAGKLAEAEAGLATLLPAIDAALSEQQVILLLPRFQLETAIPLKEALGKLGMPSAFTDAADFSGITTAARLSIQAVLHKAFIAVAEKGTEAAAATGVVAGVTSAPQGLRVSFTRPFLYFLRDDATGSILFMGRVSDPAAK
jgi:serpin B